MLRLILYLLSGIVLMSCSAPPILYDLERAEMHRKYGEKGRALAAYERARESCQKINERRRRQATCRSAWVGRAEIYEERNEFKKAAAAYAEIPAALPKDSIAGALAHYRAGRLYLSLLQEKRAYEHLWKTIVDYPNEAFATDALKLVVFDGTKRAPTELFTTLRTLYVAKVHTEIADNLLLELAKLAEEFMHDSTVARAYFDQIWLHYPKGPLNDDALWHSARLSKELGDFKGAAKRLQTLLATREVALGPGSYFSIWLDNSQLELGLLRRDHLRQLNGALEAFRALHSLYPKSILRDDATFEEAKTLLQMKKAERACSVLARLKKKWPDSRYEFHLAPALRKSIPCEETRP